MGSGFEHLLRELAPQVLGAVIRRFRDFAAAEDAVQEALLAAATQWPHDGVPGSPLGWLIQVASRRMTDQIRSETARRRRETEAALETGYVMPPVEPSGGAAEDDTLILIYMCCHPALTMSSAIALTLRAVGGLTTGEIARAFLVPESTMAQRISRAKQTIRDSGIPFRMPAEPRQSIREVLHVLYLIFNEGYTASSGEHLQRTDLALEAIRLARAVHERLPGDPEVAGLLALMLLTDARRSARSGATGEVIPLDEQDRSLWDRGRIAEGVALVSSALAKGAVGPYQLQAAIAAVHDEAASWKETDWPQLVALYELLMRMSDNPMVMLNHAVAVAMVAGPREGLRLLERLDEDGRLRGNHRLDAVRGHLLEMAGDRQGAAVCFRAAAAKTASLPERNYLMAKAAREGLNATIGHPMKIAIGADHAGFEIKEKLREKLASEGHEVVDFGTSSKESTDYPDYAHSVGTAVIKGEAERGILVCSTGVGMSIAANKMHGIRAGLGVTLEEVGLMRKHNDANVLAIGSLLSDAEQAAAMTEVFLHTSFEGGRHARRVGKISKIEEENNR